MKRSAPLDNTTIIKLDLSRLIEDIKHDEENTEDIEEAAESIINDYYEDNYNEDYQDNYIVNYLATLIHLQNESIEYITINQLKNIEKYFNGILFATDRLASIDYEDIEKIFNNYDSIVLGYK
jgi:hypothetical protein